MSLNRLLYSLRLNADIALCDCGGAVLQKALDQGDIIPIVFVNLCGIPFAEAVGAGSWKLNVAWQSNDEPANCHLSPVNSSPYLSHGKRPPAQDADEHGSSLRAGSQHTLSTF